MPVSGSNRNRRIRAYSIKECVLWLCLIVVHVDLIAGTKCDSFQDGEVSYRFVHCPLRPVLVAQYQRQFQRTSGLGIDSDKMVWLEYGEE